MESSASLLGLRLATPQAHDLLFAVLSVALFLGYHAWCYSWHLWPTGGWEPLPGVGACGGGHRRRLDMTGQTARAMFTRAVLASGSDQDFSLAVQTMRNPITAASILGTGASVGVTTLINVVLDSSKMEVVRELSRRDPLTGGSSIIGPKAKLGAAVGALFLSFFALAQALRLFVHYPFLVRAAHHCRSTGMQQANDESGDWLANEALKTCLRGQTFFSVGLRGLYAFIPLVMWTMGGTFQMCGTFVEVVVLYELDQV